MENGTRLSSFLWEKLSDKEYPNILYYLTTKYGWDSSDIINDKNIEHLKTDIKQARGAWKYEMAKELSFDDEDDFDDEDNSVEDISFWCSNDEGEGMVTFVQENGHWVEHWSDWKDYDEGSDNKPDSMRYMSYLTKDDLKTYLYRDGFKNITEVEG